MFETGINEGVNTSLETRIDDFEDVDSLFCRNVVGISLQHFFRYHPFHVGERDRSKILITFFLQF